MLNYTVLSDNKIVEIKIDLIESPVSTMWQNVLRQSMKNLPYTKWFLARLAGNDYKNNRSHVCKYCSNSMVDLDLRIRVALAKCYNSFIFINKRNLIDLSKDIKDLEFLLSNPNCLTQNYLNRWHRYFTFLEKKHSKKYEYLPPNTMMDDLYEYIHDINETVHKLEYLTYWKLPRRKKFSNPYQYTIQFTNANHHSYFHDKEGNHNVWDYVEKLVGYSYDNINDLQNNDYTVWLNEDIIGKDQIKAWLDHDDLTQEDITGNFVVTPSVIFDPNKLYKRVIDDFEFQQESKLSGKTIDRYPIGNIINLEEIDWQAFLKGKLIKITNNNEVIWEMNYE